MSTTRVDPEDISSTRSEKFLAIILTVFLLIGAGWTYYKIGDWVGTNPTWSYTEAEQRTIDERDDAWAAQADAETALDQANIDLEFAQQELSYAQDSGQPTAAAARDVSDARAAQLEARETSEELTAAAREADEAATRAERAAEKRWSDAGDARDWITAGLRLAFIALLTAGGFVAMNRLRSRESRYLPLAFAVAATGSIMAVVFAFDYITDYVDFLDLGPIVLSLVGIAATIVAFAVLQRHLARRIPRTRVRKGECPYCAFPVTLDEGEHCGGCGRDVVAACAACEQPRRVGTPYCPTCGAAS